MIIGLLGMAYALWSRFEWSWSRAVRADADLINIGADLLPFTNTRSGTKVRRPTRRPRASHLVKLLIEAGAWQHVSEI